MAENSKAQAARPLPRRPKASLLDDILSETKLKPTDEGYDVTRKGIQALLKELLRPSTQNEKVDKAFADALIAEIDEKISKPGGRHPPPPGLPEARVAPGEGSSSSSTTRDFRENIKTEVLNVSKNDLVTDFEDAPEITKSGLYRIAYTAEYGTFGGKPYGAIFSNYEFGPGPQDIQLLQNCAAGRRDGARAVLRRGAARRSSATRTSSSCPTSAT